jgi:hypothetical protein
MESKYVLHGRGQELTNTILSKAVLCASILMISMASEAAVGLGLGEGATPLTFKKVDAITISAAQGGGSLLLAGQGLFDTIRPVDQSSLSSSGENNITGNPVGGSDVDALRVTPIPLPAAAWLVGSALLGFVSLSRRKVP